MMKFIFGIQINKVFYKLILSFWVDISRYAQSTQNKVYIFAITPENIGDGTDFLPADKHKSFQHFEHQNFVQRDTIFIDGYDQAFSKYSK